MIDKKLRRIQIVTAVIVIVVGFFFIGCVGAKPQKIQFKSCEEAAGVETECRTFEINAKVSILPF